MFDQNDYKYSVYVLFSPAEERSAGKLERRLPQKEKSKGRGGTKRTTTKI